jgi:hypothetical protein
MNFGIGYFAIRNETREMKILEAPFPSGSQSHTSLILGMAKIFTNALLYETSFGAFLRMHSTKTSHSVFGLTSLTGGGGGAIATHVSPFFFRARAARSAQALALKSFPAMVILGGQAAYFLAISKKSSSEIMVTPNCLAAWAFEDVDVGSDMIKYVVPFDTDFLNSPPDCSIIF